MNTNEISPSVAIETITPEMAKNYLKNSVPNRRVKRSQVEALARDIKNGNFVLTHQGIAFDNAGRLFDGQHRLMSIVAAGIPVNMLVTRGLAPSAMSVTDRGVSRSIVDIMRAKSDAGDMVQANEDVKILSALSQMVACSYNHIKITVDDMTKMADVFKDEIESIHENVLNRSYARKNRAPVIAAAIAAMKCGVDIDSIQKFFAVFNKDDISGCYDYNCQAVLNWKRQIDEMRAQRIYVDSRKLYYGTQNAIWHFVNNTDAQRVLVPKTPRYDTLSCIKEVFEASKQGVK